MFVNEHNRERKFHLLGWILFVVCAGFFIASHAKADNLAGLIGSVIFLFACVVFIIPLVTKRNRD